LSTTPRARPTSRTAPATFSRPEDGAWNPLKPNEYYFVTTDRIDTVHDGLGAQVGQSRLWRLTFDDIRNPDLGGKIDLLIDGRVVGGDKATMFDNIGVHARTGLVVLQEDVGNAAHNGKVWLYDPATDVLSVVAEHDVARFGDVGVPSTSPYTQDEESSGVIDVSSFLGAGNYLLVDQSHYAINAANPRGFTNPDELVEGGQLMLMHLPFPVASDKSRCKEALWRDAFRADGTTFKNLDACVDYVNTGK
jgi:hypothetical protein